MAYLELTKHNGSGICARGGLLRSGGAASDHPETKQVVPELLATSKLF